MDAPRSRMPVCLLVPSALAYVVVLVLLTLAVGGGREASSRAWPLPVAVAVPGDVTASGGLATASGDRPSSQRRPAVGPRRPGAPSADPVWLTTTAARTGIPLRALAGYAAADLRVSAESPGCRLHWPTLAGIGAVESGHGAAGGGLVDDGSAARPIVGIALDGRPGVATVRDTDAGRLDGDARQDRAVGPMQFIPSTWSTWGADGDGDGVADPQDIDDSAVAAARYLCGSGGDVSSAKGWIRAVLGYNASMAYVHEVNRAAVRYVVLSRG